MSIEDQKNCLDKALRALERLDDPAGSRRMAVFWIERCLAHMGCLDRPMRTEWEEDMNAPKKIWVLPGLAKKLAWARTKEAEDLYIRADIVDELVEALQGMLDWFGYPEEHECSRSDKARAALAKLEEK